MRTPVQEACTKDTTPLIVGELSAERQEEGGVDIRLLRIQ